MALSPETYGAIMGKKGKPNGLAPLNDDGKIDGEFVDIVAISVEDETLVITTPSEEASP